MRAASDHSRLKAMREGYLDSYDSLSSDYIDNLGDFYIHKIFRHKHETIFGRGSRWRESVLPESVRSSMLRVRAGDRFTVEEKREALRVWYDELAKGPDSALPKTFKDSFRKSKAGFTDDAIDQTLLEGPPEGVDVG